MQGNTQKTVFVGLSGGVDSSVAALRLIYEGYNVVGVFIRVWHPPFLVCNWEAERLDAMRVAAHLNIPFLTCDARDAYKTEVAEVFINAYKNGTTPNPDVLCNSAVKFGVFYDFAKAHGADYIATGHYARIDRSGTTPALMRGVDSGKDQSYFLWHVAGAKLEHVLFPVGDTPKEDIRREASRGGLPVAEKRDSQGICFLGHIDIPAFLGHYTDLAPGDVLDEDGEVIGEHSGALVYTLGQRHGFTITEPTTDRAPHYVIARDLDANTVTVATTPPALDPGSELTLRSVNWFGEIPSCPTDLEAQFRYRQTPLPVRITTASHEECILTVPNGAQVPAVGQSCVIYDGAVCRGGGIIVANGANR